MQPLLRLLFALLPGLVLAQTTMTFNGPTAGVVITPVPVTPPVLDPARNMAMGCVIAPNDSVFNAPIDTLPVHANSAAWITTLTGVVKAKIALTPGWGFNAADASTQRVPMTFHYTSYDNGAAYPVPPMPDRDRQTGSLATDGNNDHHMVVIDTRDCTVYETYQMGITGNPWNAASGFRHAGFSNDLPPVAGGTDAAGLSISSLLLRYQDLASGQLQHALEFTACGNCISKQYLWPARYSTGYNASAPAMGTRWRLKASYDISGYSPLAQVILRGLQQYGMILHDIGITGQIGASSDINLYPGAKAAIDSIAGRIDMSQFEIVDESSLMMASNTGQVAGYSGNATATVGVGTPYPTYTAQVGTKLAIPGWVTMATDQRIAWSLVSGPGSVGNGVYSATAPGTAILQGTALADPTNPTMVMIQVVPAGAVRVNVGGRSYTDAAGSVWSADPFTQTTGSFNTSNDWYPASNWTGIADAPLVQTMTYTWGDDLIYGPYVMAPGTYKVTFLFSRNSCTGTYSQTATTNNGMVWGPLMTEVNGQDQMYTPSGSCRTPEQVVRTITTESGVIRLGVRGLGGQNTHSTPYLNAYSIE